MNLLLFNFCRGIFKQKARNSCWIWPWNNKRGRGYGSLNHNKKNIRAHRVSYELFYGKIPNGLYICHKCDNPPCVNPKHLFLCTQKENVYDAIKKGRHKTHFIKLETCKRGHAFSGRLEFKANGKSKQRCDECRKYQKGGIFYERE